MNKEFEKKRQIISVCLILLAVIIIVVMAVNILGKGNNANNTNNAGNTTNYTTTTEGNKVNTSTEVSSDKTVSNMLLEQSKIIYTNGTSQLTSKVTNDSVAKDNLRFTVKFMANDGSVIAEAVGYVGKIEANETKFIDSYITTDVSNSKNVVYEVMQ